MKHRKRSFFLAAAIGIVIVFLWSCQTTSYRTTTEPSPPMQHYKITGSGGATTGPLRINRVELNFQNDRGEITVPMNSKLRAYAVIRFDGNGLFRASWVVDGRAIEEVSIVITYGNTLTLWTAPGTVLPTFEPGPHTLTLQIKQPRPVFRVPVIRYFVTGQRSKQR